MRALKLLALPLTLLLLTGCGGDEGTDAGTTRDAGMSRDAAADSGRCTEFTREYCPREYPMVPIPADLVCDAFVDAFCRANGLCCSDDARVYEDFAACVADQTLRCEDAMIGFEFPSRIAGGSVLFNQAAAGNQFASLATMGDMCIPIRYGDAILAIYRGEVPTGSECTHSVECADNGECVDSGTLSTCVAAPERLDACTNNDDCAQSELRCNATECDFRLAPDEPCTENRDCESLYCRSGFCFEATPDSTYCVDLAEAGPAFE